MKIFGSSSRFVLVLAVFLAAAPAFAGSLPAASGSPEETLLAQRTGFVFPAGLRTSDGRRLPSHAYDLELLRTRDGLVLRVTDEETGGETRLGPVAIGEVIGQPAQDPSTATVLLLAEEGQDLLMLQSSGLATAFSLVELHQRL